MPGYDPQALESVAPEGKVNLSDAPAALDDATFDSLFPAEPTPAARQIQEPAASSPANSTPAQPTTTEPYLRGTKSVYNSPEAAVEGINQKDILIDTLRQRYALTTGIDPITNQPVQNLSQPSAPPVNDYYNSPSKYLSDLYDAAKKSPEAYRDVQTKFMFDTLKPLQPILQRAAREQAVETVSKDTSGVREFIGSPQYTSTLDSVPELGDAIRTAEADYRYHERLPGLYKIAYLAGQGRQLPEILKANASQPNNAPAAPRPTMQPSTPSLPQAAPKPSFKTIDGIRASIAEAEGKGLKLDF